MPDDQASRAQPSSGRGREAESPQNLPASGWKDVGLRVWGEISENNILLIAGGVTYSIVLALFPGLAALVSVYGLVLDPSQVEKQVGAMSNMLPPETRQLISQQLHALVSSSSGSLGIGLVVSLLFALWTASRGMSGLISGINIAYQEKETRSFLRFNLVALVLTIGLIVGGLIAIALIGVLPAVVQTIGLGPFLKWVMLILEWPILVVLLMAGLAMLYRYAPDRDEPQWRWVSPGAIVATTLWIIGSIAFTIYVSNFGSYNATYGSLAGAVVLLTWLYLSAVVVLVGAAINAQSERQTEKDTTRGPPQPMGQRGAYAADVLGESPGQDKPRK
jgi:membrane protein